MLYMLWMSENTARFVSREDGKTSAPRRLTIAANVMRMTPKKKTSHRISHLGSDHTYPGLQSIPTVSRTVSSCLEVRTSSTSSMPCAMKRG